MTSKNGPIHPDWAESEAKRCQKMNDAFVNAMRWHHPEIKMGVAEPDPDARPRRILPAHANPGWNGSQLGDF